MVLRWQWNSSRISKKFVLFVRNSERRNWIHAKLYFLTSWLRCWRNLYNRWHSWPEVNVKVQFHQMLQKHTLQNRRKRGLMGLSDFHDGSVLHYRFPLSHLYNTLENYSLPQELKDFKLLWGIKSMVSLVDMKKFKEKEQFWKISKAIFWIYISTTKFMIFWQPWWHWGRWNNCHCITK